MSCHTTAENDDNLENIDTFPKIEVFSSASASLTASDIGKSSLSSHTSSLLVQKQSIAKK